MRRPGSCTTSIVSLLVVILLAPARVGARLPGRPAGDAAQKSLVLDGSAVLTVGQLHVNITNWGLIGSQYSMPSSYFGSPSAQWPGGSGEEYIYCAGLWIGGMQYGDLAVSAGQPESELRPLPTPESVL